MSSRGGVVEAEGEEQSRRQKLCLRGAKRYREAQHSIPNEDFTAINKRVVFGICVPVCYHTAQSCAIPRCKATTINCQAFSPPLPVLNVCRARRSVHLSLYYRIRIFVFISLPSRKLQQQSAEIEHGPAPTSAALSLILSAADFETQNSRKAREIYVYWHTPGNTQHAVDDFNTLRMRTRQEGAS